MRAILQKVLKTAIQLHYLLYRIGKSQLIVWDPGITNMMMSLSLSLWPSSRLLTPRSPTPWHQASPAQPGAVWSWWFSPPSLDKFLKREEMFPSGLLKCPADWPLTVLMTTTLSPAWRQTGGVLGPVGMLRSRGTTTWFKLTPCLVSA